MSTGLTIPAPQDGLSRRVSDALVTRHGLLLLLLLVPPLLWLGIVYLGSLFALLAESLFSIDDFSGVVVREPTLASINWSDIEALFKYHGAEIKQGRGSRVRIFFDDRAHVFHRPHPEKEAGKKMVEAVRDIFREAGIVP